MLHLSLVYISVLLSNRLTHVKIYLISCFTLHNILCSLIIGFYFYLISVTFNDYFHYLNCQYWIYYLVNLFLSFDSTNNSHYLINKIHDIYLFILSPIHNASSVLFIFIDIF